MGTSISRSWRQTCKARKLPRVAFHSLRHCHASALIRGGVDILTISRRLGHGKAAMTLGVYGHLDWALTAQAEEVRELSTKVTADAAEAIKAHTTRGVNGPKGH